MAARNEPQAGRVRTKNRAAAANRAEREQRRASRDGYRVPSLSNHARERWAERASHVDADIETAWVKSITVTPPDEECDSARLYAPCDLLFILQGGVISTVRPANYDSLETEHLGSCSECENLDRYRGGDAICRWCGSRIDTLEMENGIVITFEEGE